VKPSRWNIWGENWATIFETYLTCIATRRISIVFRITSSMVDNNWTCFTPYLAGIKHCFNVYSKYHNIKRMWLYFCFYEVIYLKSGMRWCGLRWWLTTSWRCFHIYHIVARLGLFDRKKHCTKTTLKIDTSISRKAIPTHITTCILHESMWE
jgi:hypothetical protein